MNIMERLQSQDIKIYLADGCLKLQPLKKITAEIVADVKKNKAEIIEELKANLKPSWCTLCNHHNYKFIDNRETLYCEKSQQAVCKLKKCELEYWIKDGNGQPVTIH